MSTPSTAAYLPQPSPRLYHQYPQQLPSPALLSQTGRSGPQGTQYFTYSNGASGSDVRRPASIHNGAKQQQPPHLPPPPLPEPGERDMDSGRGRGRQERRQPDWDRYYQNGVPKEIIVIDSDSEDQAAPPPSRHQGYAGTNGANDGSNRHADKKRKTAPTAAYDPVYNNKASNSTTTTDTPYWESGSHSISTGVNNPGLTAASSIASQPSAGHQASSLDGGVVGQKRKRTRAAVQDEAKRRELENDQDPLAHYHPPPNPPRKAGDVNVVVVKDNNRMTGQKVDDEDGHYIVEPNADLTDRYRIVRLLGQGTFGKVVEAFDKKKRTKCAIKVIRSVPKYRDASRIELRVLSTLASNDKNNANRCIHLRDCFDFRNHICIVTDLYGQSVFDFLKSNSFVPFPSTHIQKFARQLFTSVAFLHDLSLIHTDLKPENILLVNNQYQTFTYNRTVPSSSTQNVRSARHRKVLLDPEIRLIDFGSATFNDEYHSSVVSTRHYRAPEIILNLGWSYPCDIWSIGCILVEFFTGDALFQTHDNLEHLAMMEAVCGGKLDKDLIRQVIRNDRSSRNSAAAYFKNNKLDYPNADTPKGSKRYVRAMKKLHETIPPNTSFNKQFLDLLRRIFVYDPKKRITAKEALQHPWFRETLLDDGTEAHKIRLERERKEREVAARRQEEDSRYPRERGY